jgi:hypothetical protein
MADRVNVPDQPGYDQVFRKRSGMMGRDTKRRAGRVEAAARIQAGVRTGELKASIRSSWMRGGPDELVMKVGSNVGHALMHHRGTRPHVIRARGTKAMRYMNDRGEVVFAREIHHPGTHPNRFLADNLPLALE